MTNSRAAVSVGLVLIVATSSLTWFMLATSKDKFSEDATYALLADFTDASGIRWKTRVQINGIDVGKIGEITHARAAEGRLIARVTIRILKEFDVYSNARVRKAAESLLGDFRIDLDPGFPSSTSHKLQPGDIIPADNVQSVSDLEEIQSRLRNVATQVENVTDSLSKVLSGPEGEGSLKAILSRVENSMEAIESATGALSNVVTNNDELLSEMISDLHTFSRALAQASSPGGDLKRVTENMASLTARLDNLAGKIAGIVDDDNAPEGDRSSLRDTLSHLNTTIENLDDITHKINDGQGSIGKMVNDPAIADTFQRTLEDTSELIGSLSRLQTQIELRSEYGVPFAMRNGVPRARENEEVQAAIKNILGLRIVPKPDKYYLFEAIADPRGRTRRSIKTTVVDGQKTVTEQQIISFNDLKFSAQFAKRYYFLTLRFGIIENTGGLGMNLHALDDDLEFRFDLYDFDRRDPTRNQEIFPRFRSTALYQFIDHIYVQTGLDDPFNTKLRTWFLGGVLRFNDEDLKALLTVAPAPPQ